MTDTFRVKGFWRRVGVLLTGEVRSVEADLPPVYVRRDENGWTSIDRREAEVAPDLRYQSRPIIVAKWSES